MDQSDICRILGKTPKRLFLEGGTGGICMKKQKHFPPILENKIQVMSSKWLNIQVCV